MFRTRIEAIKALRLMISKLPIRQDTVPSGVPTIEPLSLREAKDFVDAVMELGAEDRGAIVARNILEDAIRHL